MSAPLHERGSSGGSVRRVGARLGVRRAARAGDGAVTGVTGVTGGVGAVGSRRGSGRRLGELTRGA